MREVGSSLSIELRDDFSLTADAYYEGYENVTDEIYTRDFAILMREPLRKDVAVYGEYCWARQLTVDDAGDEIFDSTTQLLILRPSEIIPVGSDFGADIFAGKHGLIIEDAEAELHTAAFEMLLNELGQEYERCIGHPYPDSLPEAIVDVLRNRSMISVTHADIRKLRGEVIQLFSRHNKISMT